MKILIISHNFPRFRDDHPQFILELALSYKKAGHHVVVLAADHKEIQDNSLDFGVTVKRFKYFLKKYQTLGWGKSSKGDMSVSLYALLLSPLFLIAATLAAAKIVCKFKPDIVHAHWVIPNGFVSTLISKMFKVKLVVSLPGSDVQAMRSNFLLRRLGLFSLNTASFITTNSHDLKDAAVQCGANPEKFRFILYGSLPDKDRPDEPTIKKIKADLKIEPEETVVLAVGRLVAKKGFQDLVKSVPLISYGKFKVLIVGEGPLKEKLMKEATSLGISDKIIFAGNVPYRMLPQYYMLSNMLVAPSVRQPADGLNVVVTEAMKYGLPIVSTGIGGNEFVVFNRRNGLHCREADPQSLATAIGELINAPDLRQQYGKESEDIFARVASWDIIAKQYLALFSSILGRHCQ